MSISLRELTPKQENFVREYLIDSNATQAAKRAGYKNGEWGRHLLTIPHVSCAIQEAQAKRAARLEIDADYVLRNLIEVSQRCLQGKPVERFNFATRKKEQVTDAEGRGVWEFDSNGANRALELLGRHLGMFKERYFVTMEEGVRAVLEVLPAETREKVLALLREKCDKSHA